MEKVIFDYANCTNLSQSFFLTKSMVSGNLLTIRLVLVYHV